VALANNLSNVELHLPNFHRKQFPFLVAAGLLLSRFSVVHSRSLFGAMLFLALPVLAEESLMLLVGWTDWWLTGHFVPGDAAKAAMSLMAYTMWLIPSLFAAISIGATAMVARYVGAQDPQFANRCANQAMLLGLLLSVFITMIAFLYQREFIALMQLPEAARDFANSYLRIMIPVIPLIMIHQVGTASLRGAGDTLSGLIAKIVVNIVNVTLSTGLVTGWGFFPKLGFAGLAIGTATGHAIGGLIILGVLIHGRAGLKLKFRLLQPRGDIISRLLQIGLPGGAEMGLMIICQFTFVRIVFQLGEASAAAHGLAIELEALAYLPGTAFQVAAATMSGQFLGAADPRRAVQSVKVCCAAGGFVMTTAAVILYFFGTHLASWFTGPFDTSTTVTAGELLKIVALGIPSLSLVMVISGALRGAGDTRWLLLITFAGFILIRLPLAYVFTRYESLSEFAPNSPIDLPMGVYAAWYAMLIDLVIRSFMITARLLHGGWMKIKV
jgi:putative MATE family efflux protein